MPAPAPQQVVAAVIRRDGRYCVAQRPPHKHHGGLWEFPGGKVADGESSAQALARELREELAVRLLDCGPCLHRERDPESGLIIEFIPAIIAGEPALLEHSALAWHRPADLEALPLAPADARFVRAYLLVNLD